MKSRYSVIVAVALGTSVAMPAWAGKLSVRVTLDPNAALQKVQAAREAKKQARATLDQGLLACSGAVFRDGGAPLGWQEFGERRSTWVGDRDAALQADASLAKATAKWKPEGAPDSRAMSTADWIGHCDDWFGKNLPRFAQARQKDLAARPKSAPVRVAAIAPAPEPEPVVDDAPAEEPAADDSRDASAEATPVEPPGAALLAKAAFRLWDGDDCKALLNQNDAYCRTGDCKALLNDNDAYCDTDDCKGAMSRNDAYCKTGDCKAALNENDAYCDSGDCKAYLNHNDAYCASGTCKAILNGNDAYCGN